MKIPDVSYNVYQFVTGICFSLVIILQSKYRMVSFWKVIIGLARINISRQRDISRGLLVLEQHQVLVLATDLLEMNVTLFQCCHY